jgi:hypothetical protein
MQGEEPPTAVLPPKLPFRTLPVPWRTSLRGIVATWIAGSRAQAKDRPRVSKPVLARIVLTVMDPMPFLKPLHDS